MNSPILHRSWLAFGIALLTSPAAVLAGSDADSGWFVEAGYIDVDSSRQVGGFTLDGNESGWSLSGGYAFNKYFSVQASYHDFGSGHFATDCPPPLVCLIENLERADIDGVSISAVGTWPITKVFDVYGKLGVMSWDTRFRDSALDESDEDLHYGIGIGVNLSPQWRLNVQYEKVEFDLESAGVGVKYRF